MMYYSLVTLFDDDLSHGLTEILSPPNFKSVKAHVLLDFRIKLDDGATTQQSVR